MLNINGTTKQQNWVWWDDCSIPQKYFTRFDLRIWKCRGINITFNLLNKILSRQTIRSINYHILLQVKYADINRRFKYTTETSKSALWVLFVPGRLLKMDQKHPFWMESNRPSDKWSLQSQGKFWGHQGVKITWIQLEQRSLKL